MTAQNLAELYLLSRSLWWRHELGLLSDEAVSELVKVLRSARAGIVAQIEAEAQGLASISEWTRERNDQISAWIDEVLAGTSASVTSYISEASVGVALASVATYNSILSFDGKAKAVKLVEGLTREQVKQFFQDQPLGGKLLSDWVGNAFSTGARDSILDAIREGVVVGEGYRKLVKRVMAAADAGFSITQREATTLVRTYVQSANTGAQEAVYEQNEGIIKGYKRVETLDTHTCRICALADGTVYKKGEKRPELPAHPNCVIGETSIFAPDYIAAFVTSYSGPVFEITFSNGTRVTTTGNHMFLTDKGFTPAKSLNKGENVFCGSGKVVSGGVFPPDNNGQPTRIDKIVDAFSKSEGVSSVRVPTSPEYLHGDGEFCQGYIDVIAPDCLLRGDHETFFNEFLGENFFSKALDKTFSFDTKRYFPPMFFGLWLASNCHMSGRSILDVFLSGSTGCHHPVGLSISPSGNACFNENRFNDDSLGIIPSCKFPFRSSINIRKNKFFSGDSFSNFSGGQSHFLDTPNNSIGRNAEFLSYLRKTFISKIPFTQVVGINIRSFSGHMYDLQTISSLYQVNGIVTSNCRGVYVPILKTFREIGLNIDELEEVARPWTIREPGPIGTGGRKILNFGTTKENFGGWWESLSAEDKLKTSVGPVRGKLLEEGLVRWEDLSDKRTGLPYTLEQLGFDEQGNPLH